MWRQRGNELWNGGYRFVMVLLSEDTFIFGVCCFRCRSMFYILHDRLSGRDPMYHFDVSFSLRFYAFLEIHRKRYVVGIFSSVNPIVPTRFGFKESLNLNLEDSQAEYTSLDDSFINI